MNFSSLGNGGRSALFLWPLAIFTANVHQPAKTSFERKKDRLALISFALVSLGGALKVMHLVTADETLIVGMAVFSFGYLPMLFLKMYRESIAG